MAGAEAEGTALHPALPAGYRVLRQVHTGPQSTLLQAERLDDASLVALKCWTCGTAADAPGSAEAESLRRLGREARLLARLEHPAIVPILAHGDLNGQPWLAMPWMAGGSLAQRLAGGVLPDAWLGGRLGVQLALALQHAHAQGVLHRDIKPSNVLLTDAGWDVRLGDFGLAQWDDPGATATRTGVMLASPAYAAPEQLLGAPLTAASDLYALGVLLFEALTGRLPFVSSNLGGLLRAVAQQPAPPLRSIRPDVPEALAAVVAALLAKSPAARPASAADVAAALVSAAG